MAAVIVLLFLGLAFHLALAASVSPIHWINCAQRPPWTLNTTGINLAELPSVLQCGTIIVPMDYTRPIGPKNNISVGLAMVRPKNPKGVIFHNPGGTDEATIFAWQAALNLSDVFSGLEEYDLMSMVMDVRGTYSSNPLNVSLDLFGDLLGPYPTTQTGFNALKKASSIAVQSWNDLSSPPGIIQHVGTREVVQDFEMIRKALGYAKINFVGSSYGSYRAAQYATTFPKHIGNFVLDSVTPHGLNLVDQAQDLIVALNRALVRVDAFCQNNASCPFRSEGRGSVPQTFDKILTQAQNQPLNASECADPSQGCISPVSVSNIRAGMLNMLSNAPDFSQLLGALALAATGDGYGFAEAAGDPLSSIQPIWAMPLLCNDYDFGNNSFESFQRSFQAGIQKDTYKMVKTQVWLAQVWPSGSIGWSFADGGQLLCSGWPYPVPPMVELPTFEAPILLMTADFDVNTPTEWARFALKQYTQAAFVVRHGDDHVSFILPDQPATQIAKNFLRSGKLPAARNETQVAVYQPGMSIAPIAKPYNVATGSSAGDIDSA